MYLLTIALLPPRTLPAASLFSQTVPPVFASNLPFLLILLFPSLTIYPPSLCPPILRLSLSTYPSSKFLRHDSANNQILTPFSGEILIFLFSHFFFFILFGHSQYLKAKLRKEQSELVSVTTQLKLIASDGKKYNTDVISQAGVEILAKSIRNQQAMSFLDWFKYSEDSIDGQSRKKAYTLWESNLVADKDVGKVKALQQIHAYLFGGLYDFAGKIRTKTISKGNTLFCLAEHLHHF